MTSMNDLTKIISCTPESATLRDQFAMAALTGLLANPNTNKFSIVSYDHAHDLITRAYGIASHALCLRRELK